MQFKLAELKAEKARAEERRITWAEIEDATGVRNNMLISMNNGSARQVRPEYIDALCKYFGVALEQLCALDDVDLPLGDIREPYVRSVTADEAQRNRFVAYLKGKALISDDELDNMIGALWHSKEPLPDDAAEILDLEPPATFAQAAQRVRAQQATP